MMPRSRMLQVVGLAAAVVCPVPGCRSDKQVQQVPEVAIPLKVWVVLAQGEEIEEEGVAPAHRDNKGCRFTETEMRQRVQILQKNASLYGPNVLFAWDEVIAPIEWAQLAAQGDYRGRANSFFAIEVMLAPEYCEEGAINVYFGGNIESSETDPVLNFNPGLCVDPQIAADNPWPPYIVINDCAWERDFGFVASPNTTLHWFIVEHEMTHYLARFRERAFFEPPGSKFRYYNSAEHMFPDSNNVLAAFGQKVPPCPLHIPGDFSNPNTEAGEIWNRIRFGNWNDP